LPEWLFPPPADVLILFLPATAWEKTRFAAWAPGAADDALRLPGPLIPLRKANQAARSSPVHQALGGRFRKFPYLVEM